MTSGGGRRGRYSSHGTGEVRRDAFRAIGTNVIFEFGVLVFHPENITLGSNIYIGHYAIIKAYHRNEMTIGDGTWIGQQCMFHAAGGLRIGRNVGIAPGVRILTSQHADPGRDLPLARGDLETAKVVIEDDANIGWGALILPGVTIGRGSLVGAGSVVTRSVEPYAVVAGVPARMLRERPS